MTKFFNTVDDMLQYYYGGMVTTDLRKDAPVINTTTVAVNAIYGARLFAQIALGKNAWGALPKKPYEKGGYRVVSAAAASSTTGVADGAAKPATIKPTMAQIDVPPRLHAVPFDMGTMTVNLAGKDDVLTWEELRDYMGQEFINRLELDILYKNATGATGNGIESIDRIITSYSEIAGCTITENYGDIYGLNRDAAGTVYDAAVGHASTVDRAFQPSLLDTQLAAAMPYWTSTANKVIITGFDTYFRWGQILAPRYRFGETRITTGFNGVQIALPGVEGGSPISTYNSIPIITDPNVTTDTISRIYCVDGDYLHIALLTPILYSEVGGTQEEQQLNGKLTKEGMYTLQANTVCTKFKGQVKVMDLK